MITRADIEQALAAYWRDPVRDYPGDHPAVRALFERAEREEAARERTLREMFLPARPELVEHFVAEIHAALCDADNRSCVSPERLEAAGQAVYEITEQVRMAAERRAAPRERVRIVGAVRTYAWKMREEAWTPSVGVAMSAIVDSVADMINTMED